MKSAFLYLFLLEMLGSGSWGGGGFFVDFCRFLRLGDVRLVCMIGGGELLEML